jgi:hypothetical protein
LLMNLSAFMICTMIPSGSVPYFVEHLAAGCLG